MNTHLLTIILFVFMVCVNVFAGWQIPDWVVALPLLVMALYIIADVSFAARKVYHGHREMNRAARANKASDVQTEIDLNRAERQREKQKAQHAKKKVVRTEPTE